MKIFENNATSGYLRDYDNINKEAQFNNGPGYEAISGANMMLSIKAIMDTIDRDGVIKLSDKRLSYYIELLKQAYYNIETTRSKASQLLSAANDAKHMLDSVRYDLSEVNDTTITLDWSVSRIMWFNFNERGRGYNDKNIKRM